MSLTVWPIECQLFPCNEEQRESDRVSQLAQTEPHKDLFQRVTHEQKVTKEVRGENLLQAVGGDAVLLCQDALAGWQHGNCTAAKKIQRKSWQRWGKTCGNVLDAKHAGSGKENGHCRTKIPGEEAPEKGCYIKLWVWHDACVQVEIVQPMVPVEDKRTVRETH